MSANVSSTSRLEPSVSCESPSLLGIVQINAKARFSVRIADLERILDEVNCNMEALCVETFTNTNSHLP